MLQHKHRHTLGWPVSGSLIAKREFPRIISRLEVRVAVPAFYYSIGILSVYRHSIRLVYRHSISPSAFYESIGILLVYRHSIILTFPA